MLSEGISLLFVILAYIFFHVGNHISLDFAFTNNYISILENAITNGSIVELMNLNETGVYNELYSNYYLIQHLIITLLSVYIGSKFIVLCLFCLV
jgi:hypothetical protein